MKLHLPLALLTAVLAVMVGSPVAEAKTFSRETTVFGGNVAADWKEGVFEGKTYYYVEIGGPGLPYKVTDINSWTVTITFDNPGHTFKEPIIFGTRPGDPSAMQGNEADVLFTFSPTNYLYAKGYGWPAKWATEKVLALGRGTHEIILSYDGNDDGRSDPRRQMQISVDGTAYQLKSAPNDAFNPTENFFARLYLYCDRDNLDRRNEVFEAFRSLSYTQQFTGVLTDYYTVGGAGKFDLTEDGGVGIYETYDATKELTDQSLINDEITGDHWKSFFEPGEGGDAEGAALRFVKEGTRRTLAEEDRWSGGGTQPIGKAGIVDATGLNEGILHVRGIMVEEGTGDYTLQANEIKLSPISGEDPNVTVTIKKGAGNDMSFTLRAENTITWAPGSDGGVLLDVAEGMTFALQGAGPKDGGSPFDVSITGGGTVSIDEANLLGSDSGKINIDGGSTLDMGHTFFKKNVTINGGGNLAYAENAAEEFKVTLNEISRDVKLGGLKADRIEDLTVKDDVRKSVHFSEIGDGPLTLKSWTLWVDSTSFTPSKDNGRYMFDFLEPGRKVQFGGEDSKITLKFTDDFKGKNGIYYLWFTDGSFEEQLKKDLGDHWNDAADVSNWFNQHFIAEAGVETEFVIASGDPNAWSGKLKVYFNTGKTWVSTRHGDINPAYLISDENKWEAVLVDSDMSLALAAGDKKDDDGKDYLPVTLPHISTGSGNGGELKIENGSGAARDVILKNVKNGTTFANNIVVNNTKEGGSVNIDKQGTEALTIGGNLLNHDGKLMVSEGTLSMVGKESVVGSLGKMGENGKLNIGGMLTVEGDSNDLKESVGGTIEGAGILQLQGKAGTGENVKLDGIGIWLGKKEDSGSWGSLTVSSEGARISGLHGGVMDATRGVVDGGELALEQGLTITNDKGIEAQFSGNISAESEQTITVTGGKTSQVLRSLGSENVSLSVTEGARLRLAGSGSIEDKMQGAAYGNINVEEGSTLTIMAETNGTEAAAGTTVTAKDVSFASGSTLEVIYNLAGANGDLSRAAPALKGTSITIDKGTDITLGDTGFAFGLKVSEDLEGLTIAEEVNGLADNFKFTEDGKQGGKLNLYGAFNVYFKNIEIVCEDGALKIYAEAQNENALASVCKGANNPTAGAELLWEARGSSAANPSTEYFRFMTWAADAFKGQPTEVAKAMAAVAGSTIPIMGTAQRDALRNQLTRMRDHAGLMGLNEEYAYTELSYVHFWVEANGDFSKLDDGNGYESGYSYNAWGGTVGLEMDVNETASVAAGITALYGDIDGGVADLADGKLDSYYLSVMARFQRKRWGHTIVGIAGLNEAKLNRTVHYAGNSYMTHGSTDGYSAGLMYEVTYDIPINQEKTSMVQPLVNLSVMKTVLKGYSETGQEGQGVGLEVGDQDWMTATLAVGARYIAGVGEEAFNRVAQVELRANVAQDIGDSQGEADVALQANPKFSRTVQAAEAGKTALQLGASLRVPLSDQALLYFNAGTDIRSGLSTWNVGAGARFDF